jgi:hypothetical protein
LNRNNLVTNSNTPKDGRRTLHTKGKQNSKD